MSSKQDIEDKKQDNDLQDEEVNTQEQEEQAPKAGHSEEESSAEETDEMDKVKNEIKELKDQNLRLYAEFENFRKRTARERVELFGTANQELMGALLPIVDDFKRAIKAQEDKQAREGMELIYNKFQNILKNKGLKPMEDTTGSEFDVDTMEAITRIPAPEDKLKGKVIDEVEQGFYLGNKILRYAKVVVGE